MTNKRWTTEDKVRIIMESFTTSAGTAEICRKHGLSPNTFYPWQERFLEVGKTALARGQNAGTVKTLQKENATLKTLVGEITLTNDALKKRWGGGKNDGRTTTKPTGYISEQGSLLVRGTRKRWYHKPKARESVADQSMMQMIQKIREERPFYGTRRIAAELSK